MLEKLERISSPEPMTKLERAQIKEKLKIYLALTFEKEEVSALLERKEEHSSGWSKSETSYIYMRT